MSDLLGSHTPQLTLYLPHRPIGLEALVGQPSATALVAQNSNHWRKIVTLMAKVCAPDGDWRGYRTRLLSEQALGFAPQFHATSSWHWIGGQQNQARFRELDQPHARVRVDDDIVFEPQRRILLTPYPDYRQLSNRKVVLIRELLAHYGFYPAA